MSADAVATYPDHPDWKRVKANRTVRLAADSEATTPEWHPFKCSVYDSTGDSAALLVPVLRGTWLINPRGMVANLGGNDWRIYTLHPEDCAALCAVQAGKGKAVKS